MAGTDTYPATLELDPPERIANWRPLVQWLLAIPHLIVLGVIRFIADVCAVVSWFAVVVTGKLPSGLAGVQVTYLRYSVRTYTYAGFLVAEYPPFTYSPDGADPGDAPRVRVDLRPALVKRNRVTALFRVLLALPHFVVLSLIGIAVGLAVVVAGVAVLFTGRWPEGIRTFVVGVARWSLRVEAYFRLLTDDYPPFSLD